MINHNDIDKFNSIETGDTVYISGLLGKILSSINNKHGVILNILLTSDNGKLSYVAEVALYNEVGSNFINFNYLFLVGNKMNTSEIKSLIKEENPFNYYISKKNLIEAHPIFDENSQILGVCTDNYKRKHVFLYSGIN